MDREKNHILHELYVFSEWKPEPDFIQTSDNFLQWRMNSLLKWIPFVGPEKSLLDNISFYKERSERWQIALSDEGKVVAVLTDNILEIRTKRSDYSTIAARTTVVRDGNPQWRKIVWSPDCSFLVLAHSNGNVSFYDLTASNIFNIAADCSRPGGMECTGITHALSAIIFVPTRMKDIKWTWEVLLITHDGKLRGYLVSSTDGAKLHHTFHFASGVSSAVFCKTHSLLLTAGLPAVLAQDTTSAMHAGVSAWRILNDDPFYKLSVASDQLDALMAKGRIQYYMPFLSAKKNNVVVKMEISPDMTKLVCLHTDGEISVWRLPLLKCLHRWRLYDQPEYNCNSPLIPASGKNHGKDVLALYAPADINWWSSEEITLSRLSGAVTICSIEDMINILGKKVEFLQGVPQVTGAFDNTFLALECETKAISASQLRDADTSEHPVEREEEQGSGVVEAAKELVKSVLYSITDIEHFQPKPKKITVISRIYRLLGIKSTTPEDLFLRKIEAGSYEEALKLAESFDLDSDLVYQQQWRKTPVSCDAIHNFLAKVSKKIWVVHQCVDRLPETLIAAKDLLNFGLQLANVEIIEEVNRCREKPLKSHDQIELQDLNAHTSEMLRCRHVMLFYLERLQQYELILKTEKSKYVRDEYHRLRSNNIVYSCIELAKEGRIAALTCLWGQIDLVQMHLTVLENIPETIDPGEYSHLLPSDIIVKKTDTPVATNKDWCRKSIFRSIWNSNWSDDSTPESDACSIKVISLSDLSMWYEKRAKQIEDMSGIASHALKLLTIAESRGVPNLEQIMFNVVTLNVLLYEVNCEDVSLSKVEQMNSIEICRSLMSKSSSENFLADLKLYVLPYLKRKERCVENLCMYLESISVEDLTPVLAVLKNAEELGLDMRTCVLLAELCLLAHSTTTQLHIACDILTSVLKQTDGSMASAELVRRVNDLEKLINACNTLSYHNVHMTLKELKQIQKEHQKQDMVLVKLARNMSLRDEPPQQQDWEMLLKDMLQLRENFFTLIDIYHCLEIYASALMTSGNISTIKLASTVLICAEPPPGEMLFARLVPYNQSVELVLRAAEEYFNSALSLDDPALQLSCACLKLIKDDNPDIQASLDLISSLEILQSFGLSILPIQVQLCEDPMSLIEECLKLDPNAYQSSQKLLTLAKLLRVAGDDNHKREGMVLQRVAECAVKSGGAGWEAAGTAARRLAELRYAPAAAVLSHVAMSQYTDKQLSKLLLDAALTYADISTLEEILRARLSLELNAMEKELGDRVSVVKDLRAHQHTLHPQLTTDSAEDYYADALQTPIDEKSFEPVETQLGKIAQSFVGKTWKNNVSLGWLEKSTEKTMKEKELCYSIHCPEFYHSLYPEYLVSDLYYRYDRFVAQTVAMDAETMVGELYMKWFYVRDCLEVIDTDGLESQVVQRCGAELMWSDTALGTACMLRALRGHFDMNKFVNTAPADAATPIYCIALYFLLLQYHQHAQGEETFLTRPLQLARLMLADKEPPQPHRLALQVHIPLITFCVEQLLALLECTKLRGFGLVVDSQLFTNDEDYRTQTIYRLARSLDKEQLECALALAAKYGVEEARVWSQHAEALVLRHAAPLAPADLAARLADTDMVTALRSRTKLIEEDIWEQIPGCDHTALISYFTLMKNLEDKWAFAALSAAEHIKLLKKVKAASPDLDYKLLLSQPKEEVYICHLLRVLKPENVGLVTKLLRSLPANIKLPLSVNNIYTIWLTDLFFSVGSSATSKKWMQQYRQCSSYFNKLNQHDLRTFINNTCFTQVALQRVPANTRNLMIMQAADYCQQEQESDIRALSKIEPSWGELGQELTRWARFLENFYSSTVQAIIEKDVTADKDVWMRLECSRGDTAEARDCLTELVLNQQVPAAGLTTLLQCLHIDITLDQLFTHVLQQDMDDRQTEGVMKYILYYKSDNKLSDEVAERATRLRAHPHLQVSILSLTQKKQLLEDGDISRIAVFSLQLLKTEWSELDFIQNLSESTLLNEEGRREVFLTCMRTADSWEKKKILVDLINCWPDFNVSSDECGVYYQFVEWLLSDENNQTENGILLKMLLDGRRQILSENEIKLLSENVGAEAIENMLWIILKRKSGMLNATVPHIVNKHESGEILWSDEILKELLDNELFTKLVDTPAYRPLIAFIVHSGDSGEYTLPWAIDKLKRCNFLAEAGQLMLLHRGVPTSLKNFSESIKCLKKLSQ